MSIIQLKSLNHEAFLFYYFIIYLFPSFGTELAIRDIETLYQS